MRKLLVDVAVSFLAVLSALAVTCATGQAKILDRTQIEARIEPPFFLGDELDPGVYAIVGMDAVLSGYAFQTEALAPLPGFSGAPINILVVMDVEGKFLKADLLTQNEPIFVSGLGEAPFREFVAQYRGLSVSDSLAVGVPYGGDSHGGSMIYLDGVTKATASVRIAHESILAAALSIAREKIQGIARRPAAAPDIEYSEDLNWNDLVEKGIAAHLRVDNRQLQKAFTDTIWRDDDAVALAEPEAAYLDLWVVDLGPASIAKAVLTARGFAELQTFMSISTQDEPLLLIEAGRHGLVSGDFIRNTAPDLIALTQNNLPLALRDADLDVRLQDGVPKGTAMILRTDRRLGFDPTAPWQLGLDAERAHGTFLPEVGRQQFNLTHSTPERFFKRASTVAALSPWQEALRNRKPDLLVLAPLLAALVIALLFAQSRLAGLRGFTALRLTILAGVIGYVGWWGQGQLSIVTVLGVIRAAVHGQSFSFLLYDPFSLMIWGVVIVSFVLWGRGFFCGWMCPFGAMQEFTHHFGRLLRLPEITLSDRWDTRLKKLKYLILAGLIASLFLAPQISDTLVEIEPFKTAVTVYFIRDLAYVAYAAFWLILGMFLFKGFCRYVCPLGAVMAIGGLIRGRGWIPRRTECGTPCQLCKVKCNYQAIRKDGSIKYDDCFQCLDCITIHDAPDQCVPLILAARKGVTR